MNMYDWIHSVKDHLQIPVLVFALITLLVILLRAVLIRHDPAYRRCDLKAIWDTFTHHPRGTDEAVDLYRDGIHLVKHYGATYQSIGCADQKAFHEAACRALEKRIVWLKDRPNKAVELEQLKKQLETLRLEAPTSGETKQQK